MRKVKVSEKAEPARTRIDNMRLNRSLNLIRTSLSKLRLRRLSTLLCGWIILKEITQTPEIYRSLSIPEGATDVHD
ncbi:MAG: hypothetical protein ACHQ1H_06650, partial [Nitrososphaerales archaeon]